MFFSTWSQPLFCRGVQSTALATKNEPEACEVLHLPHGIMIMTQINNDTSFTKRHFPPFRNVVQILRAPRTMTSKSISHFDTRLPTFWQRCHACHADDKMPYTIIHVLHLSRKTTFQVSKCPGCPTPATRNGHNQKNEHGALVKRDLRKRQIRYRHFVRACAVKMHMDISQGNFYARIYNEESGTRERTLI